MLAPTLLVLGVVSLSHGVVVDTQYGQVRGKTMFVNNTREAKTVDVFRGIPFAKDTSGERRFRNPEERDPWPDVFEADLPGDMCPQRPGLIEASQPDWDRYSEDCLHVDIVSPNVTGGPYPVMVWIHGGGYTQGGNVQYPGHFLAMFDVVVAVINYRLGNFGFAFTGNDACPGNVGLWDQKMGLEFVINNIANFGGDPDQITVFGESAGGSSTAQLIVSPHTKDLFQRAILQSGTGTNYWSLLDPASNPANYTYQMAEGFGCDFPGDDEAMMDCLRQVDQDLLVYNVSLECTPGYFCKRTGMIPVVDGPGGFLPKTPAELRQDGEIMSGPIIAGVNRDEGSVSVAIVAPGTNFGVCNRTMFQEIIRERVLFSWTPGWDEEEEEEIYQAIDWRYTPWPYLNEDELNREALVRLMTDIAFGTSWDTEVKGHQSVAPTYGYLFDYRSGKFPEWMGVPHADDLPYVWGITMLGFNEQVANDSSFGEPYNYTLRDVEQTLFVQELWTNFAKFGNPTPSPVLDPLGGSTVWPTFDMEEMAVLHISNNATDTIFEYQQKIYAFWQEYMGYLLHGIPSNSATDSKTVLHMTLDPFAANDEPDD